MPAAHHSGDIRVALDTGMALDHQRLFTQGMEWIRALSGTIWTDHNLHDPGVTILEILSYALVDIAYRASLPIPDLLAGGDAAAELLPSAATILPARPLTLLDYRKLILDIPGVRNAWVHPANRSLTLDLDKGVLVAAGNTGKRSRQVAVRGLYEVAVEYEPEWDMRHETDNQIRQALRANRNLCEDFVSLSEVETQPYRFCVEIDIDSKADGTAVQAEILWRLRQFLEPRVSFHTLAEMLERTQADGSPYRVEDIFDGPRPRRGFVDDADLSASELQTEIRASDAISIVMDVPGVIAVRRLIIAAVGEEEPASEERWVLSVPDGRRPKLDVAGSRFIFYRRGVPFTCTVEEVLPTLAVLTDAREPRVIDTSHADIAVPHGRRREVGRYRSIQADFPSLYGLMSRPPGSTEALQLAGYLLHFDQVLANWCALLANVATLFSKEPSLDNTYFAQVVAGAVHASELTSGPPPFPDDPQSPDDPGTSSDETAPNRRLESQLASRAQRRHRFLDHLIARFGEDFHEYAAMVERSKDPLGVLLLEAKAAFLREYPTISVARGLGYDHSDQGKLWNTDNVSGLERRVSSLLGIPDVKRTDLAIGEQEGMHVVEALLLHPSEPEGPYLDACPDPSCAGGCVGDDPYSYRLHVILPAYAGRFAATEFRRFVEDVIRQETPAHILPRICWIDREQMASFETAFKGWLAFKAGEPTEDAGGTLGAMIDQLQGLRSVYPVAKLAGSGDGKTETPFVLGRGALGSGGEDS